MFGTRISRATITLFGLSLLLPLSAQAILSPAVVYCEELGYTYVVDETPEGQTGICEFPDGRRVKALEFVAGKVATEMSYCARNGYEARQVEESAVCKDCLVCVMADGSEVEVTRLMDLNLLETTCGDGTCGIPENFQTCPADCPSGSADGLCDGELDGKVDPDCWEGEDPDSPQAPPDYDKDGIPDEADNCTLVTNTDQRDTDHDGYGNLCDPDFDNNRNVDFADLAYMKSKFFTPDPGVDLDGNGTVDFADLAILKSMFFGPPGPSGLVAQ